MPSLYKRIFTLACLMALTGCPYTEGCEGAAAGPADDPPARGEDARATQDGDLGDAQAGDGAIADAGRDASVDPGARLDFGQGPTGGPVLSTLSCPALTMPSPSSAGTATIVYVDANATAAEAGTKAAPFRTIEKAFASAPIGAIIWVAAGSFNENLTIPDKDLLLLGGFAAGFGSRTTACATVVEALNTTLAVLTADSSVRGFALEGFSVRKGLRGIVVNGDDTQPGRITIARSVFSDNGTTNVVGGAAALESVNARIFGSVFRDNKASKGAGLASNGKVSITIDQNLFERNIGYSDHGGALYLSASNAKITRNTFRSNATGVGIPAGFGGNWGGAAIVYNNSPQVPARADFSYNVFTDNLAGIGSAVFVDDAATMTLSHDLIYRNRAYLENGALRGAALYADGTGDVGGGSTLIAEYLTVVNNLLDENGVQRPPSAAFGGNAYVEGFSKATITNSIFWNNGDNAFYVEAQNELSVSNSIGVPACTSSNAMGFIPASATICKIGQGVFQPGAVNFGNDVGNDYHEQSTAGRFNRGMWVLDAITSPAIDRADPTAPVGSEPAPNGNRANLGVFSRTSEASKSP